MLVGNFRYTTNQVAVSHQNSPYVTVYDWAGESGESGFGTKYADPATLPGTLGRDVVFSPDGNVIAVAHSTTPFVSVYPWSTGTGFGAKFTNPATLPASTGNAVAFSPAGTSIAIAHDTTPFVSVYPWSNSTGFGTKFTNPATLPTGNGNAVTFNSAVIAVGHDTTPFISVYPWSNSTGFGTKFANPAVISSYTGVNTVAFNGNENSIHIGGRGSSTTGRVLQSWVWSNSTGFGTKYSNISTPVSYYPVEYIKFHPSNDYIGISVGTNRGFLIYPWSNATGWGSPISELPGGGSFEITFNSTTVFVAHTASPYVSAYPFSTSGGGSLGTKYANPTTLPPMAAWGIAYK